MIHLDRRLFGSALTVVWLFLTSCSAASYANRADRQVHSILDNKQKQLFGGSVPFSIDQDPERLQQMLLAELAAERLRRATAYEERFTEEPATDPLPGGERNLGEEGEDGEDSDAANRLSLERQLADIERRYAEALTPPTSTDPPVLEARVLSLAESLEIASNNSRDYQTEKERVYLDALDLTFQRFVFENQYGVTSSYDWSSQTDPLSTTGRRRDGNLSTSFSLTRMLAGGGLLVFDFTNSLLRRFTGINLGNSRTDVGSVMSIAFSQPLLRGGQRYAVLEPLIQAERNVFYALRRFERFRQEFAVGIARDYYGLLQQLNVVANSRRSYVQFINSREQSENLRVRGRRSQIDTDQAVQRELRARNTWLAALRNYQDSLDRFKITLGLPIEANLAVDSAEMARMMEEGLVLVGVGETEALIAAASFRLDLHNEQDRLVDAERRVRVAANDLQTALDLNGSYVVGTDRDTVADFLPSDATWNLGVQVDLPVNRLAERNTYRASLISREVQARATSLQVDRVKQQVRAALRSLTLLRESYEIQKQAVAVGERRVASTTRYLRMGRIQIRDALEATDDLVAAQNSETAALVNYRVAVLELYRDMGLLAVTERGLELIPVPSDEPVSETEDGTRTGSDGDPRIEDPGSAEEED